MRHFTLLLAALPGMLSGQSVLPPSDFLEQVWAHHPVVQAADLIPAMADAQLQAARGAFDPKLAANVRQKQREETLYYAEEGVQLVAPTPLGLDLELGYYQTDGSYLNPELTTPAGGQLGAAVSWDVGQGLRSDERRMALRKAKLIQTLGTVERQQAMNAFTAEALSAYWNWFDAWHQTRILEESVAIAEQRKRAIVQTAAQGDRPALDTLEAGIQVLNRKQLHFEAQHALVKRTAQLESYLWNELGQPVRLQPEVVPLALNPAQKTLLPEPTLQPDWLLTHPYIAAQQNKLDQKDVELFWKRQQLKPQVAVKYQWFDAANAFPEGGNWSAAQSAFGLDFAFPLLVRKERGHIAMTEVEIATGKLELMDLKRDLELKSTAARSAQPIISNQLQVQQQAIQDSEQLLRGEQSLFDAGESSLFLINMREQYFIQAQLKGIEILHKLADNRIAIQATEAAWW